MGSLRKPKNPCTGVCAIDSSTGWCRGCWRTKAEIKQWKQLSRKARERLLDRVAERRKLRKLARTSNETHALPKTGRASKPASTLAQATPATADWRNRAVRHRRSGRTYWELHRGVLHADGTVMVVYRGEDGRVWIRPAEQFDDGRYEPVADPLPLARATPLPGGKPGRAVEEKQADG